MKEKNNYSWDSITIEQYNDMMEIFETDGMDDITKINNIISIIEGIGEDDVWNLPIDEWNNKKSKLSFLNDFKIIEKKFTSIKIGDREYIISDDINKINVAQWMDYQSIKSIKGSGIQDMLSVFLIPKGYKYNTDYDLGEERTFLLKNCNFQLAESILNFIFSKYAKSLMVSLKYLEKKILREKEQEKKDILMKELMNLMKTMEDLTYIIFLKQ